MHFSWKPLACVLLLQAAILSTSFAQAPRMWEHLGNYNGIPIRQGYHIEWSRAGTIDTGNNFCFVWSDCRNQERDVYAQKYAPDGARLWDEGGKLVVHGPVRQEDPDVASDLQGGYIVGWIDYRLDSLGDVRAQRLDANGNRLWDIDGVQVNVLPNAQVTEFSLHAMPDGSGGGIIVWHDNRLLDGGDIYAHHIFPDGALDPLWPANGKMVAGGPGNQGQAGQQSVDYDGAGGIWIAYAEARTGGDHNDIRVQHVESNGTLMFPDTMGLAVCTDPAIQEKVKLCPDGMGGALLVWVDKRDIWVNSEDIYIQRVNSQGNIEFQPNGMPLVARLNTQTNPRIVYDGIGGAIVAWMDTRNDPGNEITDIYAQRIDTLGNISWGAEDLLVCGAPEKQSEARLNSDENGGAVVVWKDERIEVAPNGDVYAQKLRSNGTVAWTPDGEVVSNAPYAQDMPLVRTIASGTSMVAWFDSRFGSPGIFCQMLNTNGAPQLVANGEQVVWGLDKDAGHPRFQKLHSPPNERILVMWQDRRRGDFGDLIYEQIIDNASNTYLPTNGQPICFQYENLDSLLYGGQVKPELCSDGAGGAIVCWEDWRTINDNWQVYAQRVDGDGNMMWDSVGIRVHSTTGVQKEPEICPDGAGGAFIAWHGSTGTYEQTHIARIDGSGNTVAVNLMPNRDSDEETHAVIPDGSGGAILVWEVLNWPRYSFYAARVDGNCDTIWVRTVCDTTGDRYSPVMKPLSGGQVVVAWEDRRSGIDYDIYAQKIDINGIMRWDINGISVVDTIGDQTMGDLSEDPEGNILIVWNDYRRGLDGDLYIQKLDGATGNRLFQSSGVPVTVEDRDQSDPSLIVEDSSGFHICWEDYRGLHSDIYASHFTSSGALHNGWSVNGDVICDFFNLQENPVMVDDFFGGAIAIWEDARSSGKEWLYNLYAQRWNDSTVSSVEAKGIKPVESFALSQNNPNPFNPVTVINFSLVKPGDVKLIIYNALGREVSRLVDGSMDAGSHTAVWNGTDSKGVRAASGIYYYRLEMDGEMKVMRMILLK